MVSKLRLNKNEFERLVAESNVIEMIGNKIISLEVRSKGKKYKIIKTYADNTVDVEEVSV